MPAAEKTNQGEEKGRILLRNLLRRIRKYGGEGVGGERKEDFVGKKGKLLGELVRWGIRIRWSLNVRRIDAYSEITCIRKRKASRSKKTYKKYHT